MLDFVPGAHDQTTPWGLGAHPSRLHALAWRYIHSQVKGAADYMAVAVVIRNAIVTGLKI